MKREKSSEGYGIFRFALVALLALANIAVTIAIMVALTRLFSFIEAVLSLLSLFLVLRMMVKMRSPDHTLAWAVILLCVPAAGLALYFSWGNVSFSKNERGFLERSLRNMNAHMQNEPNRAADLKRAHPELARQVEVLNSAHFPAYKGGSAEYFPSGEEFFESLAKDLATAKDHIFISYFIIADGELWDGLYRILAEKVKSGVTVRVMYDDFGCVKTMHPGFADAMRADGIKVAAFNPIHRYVRQLYLYYRNHQKICVIDGATAYVGGVNIADEYINKRMRFGHWKDTGMKITGGGVKSVSVTFLQMWDMVTENIETDIEHFFPTHSEDGECYMIPFADGPSNNPLNPAHDLYQTMCETAQSSIWYTTPYLTPDCPLREALCLAARGGVDVRVITPAIPDHVTVFAATRGHYQRLLNSGVRIYEYTPGFMHAKMVLCDRKSAVVGSINMDTCSFFRQYENAVWVTGSPAVEKIAEDFESTFGQCVEIDRHAWAKRPFFQRLWEATLYLMSPLF